LSVPWWRAPYPPVYIQRYTKIYPSMNCTLPLELVRVSNSDGRRLASWLQTHVLGFAMTLTRDEGPHQGIAQSLMATVVSSKTGLQPRHSTHS
jgi:hypothetical protein